MTSLKLLKVSKSIYYGYLSLFVFLLAVSCDNESDNKPPALKGLNLSAQQTDEGVKKVIETGKAYVKLTMTTDEAGTTPAKYHRATQDKSPKALQDIKFLIQTDGSIDEFFLQASDAGITYWVQQFDLYDRDPDDSKDKGTLQYSLSEKVELTLETKDSSNNLIIDVVKNESEEAGISTSLTSPSFSTKRVKGHSFTVGFLNALQKWFAKSTDYKIVFKVKHGDSAAKAKAVTDAHADYINEDLFKDAEYADNLMKITIPKSLNYYGDNVFIVYATVKRLVAGSVEHTFDILGGNANEGIRVGYLILEIKNNPPTIKVTGGDGNHAYSDNNKTFDLDNDHNIAIFVPSDKEDGKDEPLTNTYKWTLYKEGVEVTDAWIHPSTSDRSLDSKLSLYNKPSIRPAGVMISQNTSLASQTKSEISKYTLKGSAKADDGLGGITEKTVLFNFKKDYVSITDPNFLNYLKGILPANAFNKDDKLNTLCDEVKNLTKMDVHQKGIKSLQGIEYFTGLTELHCNHNQLTTLDVSQNTALKILKCHNNQFTALNISNNKDLTWLECHNNQLTSLDVSNSKDLKILWCSHDKLKALNVSNNAALTELICDYNQIKYLDVSNNTALTKLYCHKNQLTALDLSHNCKLNDLNTGLPNDKVKRCTTSNKNE